MSIKLLPTIMTVCINFLMVHELYFVAYSYKILSPSQQHTPLMAMIRNFTAATRANTLFIFAIVQLNCVIFCHLPS